MLYEKNISYVSVGGIVIVSVFVIIAVIVILIGHFQNTILPLLFLQLLLIFMQLICLQEAQP